MRLLGMAEARSGRFAAEGTPAERARRDIGRALPGWLVARAAVAISLVAAHLVYHYMRPPGAAVARHLEEGLLGWDAAWYEDIASHGYEPLPRVGLRFFPLLPLLARPLGWLLGGRYGVALLVLANVSALVLGALLHRLALAETGDAALARRAAWMVALTPPAFVLAWGYPEALSGCLAVAAFLALRTRRWGLAAGAGLLAGLTRPVGVLLALPAAIEAARGWRHAGWGERVRRAVAVAGAPAGSLLYLAWVGARFGDPSLPFSVQQGPRFRGAVANPVVVLWDAWTRLLGGDLTRGFRGNALHAPWAVVVIVLVVIVFRHWPVSYGAFAATTVLVALSTERLGSFERYAFGAFPVVLALAVLGRRPVAERCIVAVGALTVTLYGTLALLGAYVP
jgi:hypothetical protein